jgi:hypothetical protein
MYPLNNPNQPGNYEFNNIKNIIHIDEKWFYVTRVRRRIRYLPGEDRHGDETTKHKSHIEKMMFLAAVGVPQDIPVENGGGHFDGKIGVYPVIDYTVAERNSRYRPAGTQIIENRSLTAEEYLYILNKENGVLQHIREKMHWMKDFIIVIQHDNAKPHEGKENKFFFIL